MLCQQHITLESFVSAPCTAAQKANPGHGQESLSGAGKCTCHVAHERFQMPWLQETAVEDEDVGVKSRVRDRRRGGGEGI